MSVALTEKPVVCGQRKVHGLMGGGPGIVELFGRPLFFAGMTWCGVEKRSRMLLVETDAPVTCNACLAGMKKQDAMTRERRVGCTARRKSST